MSPLLLLSRVHLRRVIEIDIPAFRPLVAITDAITDSASDVLITAAGTLVHDALFYARSSDRCCC